MSNIAIGGSGGGRQWAFYETIACGSGGRPCCDGVDAVQTNMTNTLNTPIELLEREYPILFKEYSIRPGSGGPGMYRGGNGVIRAFKVMEDGVRLTVTGERVRTRPWGLHGGLPGEPAVYAVERRDGRVEVLPSKGSAILYSGDTVVVKTPGGGGYGDPCRRSRELSEKDVAEGRVTREWLARLRGECKG